MAFFWSDKFSHDLKGAFLNLPNQLHQKNNLHNIWWTRQPPPFLDPLLLGLGQLGKTRIGDGVAAFIVAQSHHRTLAQSQLVGIGQNTDKIFVNIFRKHFEISKILQHFLKKKRKLSCQLCKISRIA